MFSLNSHDLLDLSVATCSSSNHTAFPLPAVAVTLLTQVVIRRRPLFYTVNLLLPSIFLMVMDIVGFYLPPDSGERVSFKITLLLGYSVFLIIVSDTLPATAIGTPLIGKRDCFSRRGLQQGKDCHRMISLG